MDELIKLMDTISQDVEQDIKNFEGTEFNGRNVAELFGYQAAAIQALAKSLKVVATRVRAIG